MLGLNQRNSNKRLAQGLLLSLLVGTAIACQPQSSSPTASSSPTDVPDQASNQTDRRIYSSDRFNFQFNYPNEYVLISTRFPSATEEGVIENIEIWSQQDYTAIYAGENQITELPPNVTIAVYENDQQISLEDWVRTTNRFGVLAETFEASTIADQEALSFTSSGLYENENVVVLSPEESAIIVISLATIGSPDNDETYRSVFQQILSTFQFRANAS
jgi:hypothetical protein